MQQIGDLNLKETELLHDRSSKEDISFKMEDVLAAPCIIITVAASSPSPPIAQDEAQRPG
jgi:hypothetical protein